MTLREHSIYQFEKYEAPFSEGDDMFIMFDDEGGAMYGWTNNLSRVTMPDPIVTTKEEFEYLHDEKLIKIVPKEYS